MEAVVVVLEFSHHFMWCLFVCFLELELVGKSSQNIVTYNVVEIPGIVGWSFCHIDPLIDVEGCVVGSTLLVDRLEDCS